jgi:hypothetical protein
MVGSLPDFVHDTVKITHFDEADGNMLLLSLIFVKRNHSTMFKNFFLSAHRYKIQSAIQFTSLTIGITSGILIGLYAKFEWSYDRFHEKGDRIYRLEYADNVGLPLAPGYQIR